MHKLGRLQFPTSTVYDDLFYIFFLVVYDYVIE